ncbi:MAG TPA: Cys-tRNA(Pro) deacylase [Candidatus Dorea intestinavium]|nr:Cys-tRNA(Pro) deacylase [Candidatus Dorea intestinavium]
MKNKKTNAARILDRMNITYKLLEYEVDENNLDAVHVAHTAGIEPEKVFKTLCMKGDKTGVLFACLSGNNEVDLKALARLSGNKKVEMVHLKEVLTLTGYIRGGVSPLGAKKNFPVFLDQQAFLYEEISISAGMRGLQILLNPRDLQKATNATCGEFATLHDLLQ